MTPRSRQIRPPAAALARTLALLLASAALAAATEPEEKLEAFRRKALLHLGEAAFESHDIDAAQRRLEEALALGRKSHKAPESARIYEALGDVFVRRNQLGGARSFYMRSLQEAPDGAAERRAVEKLGRLAMRRGRWGDASSWLERSLKLEPSAGTWRDLGEARLRARRGEAAEQAFDEALALTAPAERAAMQDSIARRYAWAGRPDEAARRRALALELRREDADAYRRALRGLALRDGEGRLQELARLPGGAATAHRLRARRAAAENLEGAIAEQQTAVRLLREPGAAPDELAAALDELAKLEERRAADGIAATLRGEALTRRGAPDSPAGIDAVEKLAANLERSGDIDGAIALWLSQVQSLETPLEGRSLALAAACERWGDLLLRQKRYDAAASQFSRASGLRQKALGHGDGGRQKALKGLADALRRAGREDDARRAESQLALLSLAAGRTRAAPRGRRDTGTWLSDAGGLAFVGLALSMATIGLVWAGWTALAHVQPALESTFRREPGSIPAAPAWTPVRLEEPRYPISFGGRGGQLFGIWSVNMALTLVTLGLYFFWAKVRVRRYFWGQTELAGDRFSFHGTGRELLLGWLKAAPVLALALWGPGLLNLAWANRNAGLYGAGAALTLIGLLWPLAEIGATRYRLSRSSWRGIRFSFRGEALPYMKIWIGGMLLWILTLGLWGPMIDTARRRYLINHMRFGDAKLQCEIDGKDLFALHLVAWVLLLPTVGASYFWYKAFAERYYWSRTQLIHNDGVTRANFECTLKGTDLFVLWIQTAATLTLTLGLGWPWTRVWAARLRLRTLALTGDFRPGRIRQSTREAGAAGEGAADFLGLDFGFFA